MEKNWDLRYLDKNTDKEKFSDDSVRTESSNEQIRVEDSICHLIQAFKSRLEIYPDLPVLERQNHIKFLLKGLQNLSSSYECLDASRPWLCYWILHSLDILDETISEEQAEQIVGFLNRCQHPNGGFGGGPWQSAHLAPTYAAVNALAILAVTTDSALKIIDRQKMYQYLMRMRTPEGAFRMHDGGEVDVRGAYCAASVARLLHIMTPELFKETPYWIASCQTYEGGFGGCPGLEAHGGYSFCGLAALCLLNHSHVCDMKRLLRWTANRQMRYEGGFQGRTNKLVDGCYSFWQGGAFPLIHMVLCNEHDPDLSPQQWMFHQAALQEYLLICCQHAMGGLIDKPGRPRDFYHTCYCLSGLSIAQHFTGGQLSNSIIIGSPKNEVRMVHPVYNIRVDAVLKMDGCYGSLPAPTSSKS